MARTTKDADEITAEVSNGSEWDMKVIETSFQWLIIESSAISDAVAVLRRTKFSLLWSSRTPNATLVRTLSRMRPAWLPMEWTP